MKKNGKTLRSLWFPAIVLSVFLLLCAAVSAADTYRNGDWEYRVENGTASIAKYYGTASSVTLPTSVKIDGLTYKLRAVDDSAFADNVRLQTIVIPEQFSQLGNCAFKNCTNLSSVTINGDLGDKERGYWGSETSAVFYKAGLNTGGITVTFGEGVTRIPAYLFESDRPKTDQIYPLVTKLVLPRTIKEIGRCAFLNCYDLKTVQFASSGDQAKICANAFENCSSITSLTFPEGFQTIEENAFLGCIALSRITLPKSMSQLGNCAFKNCTNLNNITINGDLGDKERGYWGSESSAVFYKAGTNTNGITVTFGEGVTRVAAYLFDSDEVKTNQAYPHVTKVILSSTVREIGRYAFINCYDLKTLQFSSGGNLTKIEECGFKNCTSITSLAFPSSLKIIGESAFEGCTSLTALTLPNNLQSIEKGAFLSCSLLSQVSLPKNMSQLGDCAFKNCTNLSSVIINGNLGDKQRGYWGAETSGAFFNTGTNTAGMTVTFSEGVSRIPSYLFDSDKPKTDNVYCHVNTVYLPLTLKEIGCYAFYDCYDLSTVYYAGTKSGFAKVSVEEGNEALTGARFIYGGNEPSDPGNEPEPPGAFRFADVKNNSSYYYDAVYWAYGAKPQITNGIDKTHFGPNAGCTRGQVVTFLWRAAGCPEPRNTRTAFTDVKADAFYAKAVAWAVEKKITNGVSSTRFAPNATCTRGQIVTFLWRFKNAKAPKSEYTGFWDVKAGAFYAKAVAWAVENKITNGVSSTRFAPEDTCTRGQIVTFLYRAVNQK